MTMRVLVLTTETPHHVHFVRELIAAGHSVTVVNEHTTSPAGSTGTEFQHQRDAYEQSLWFGDKVPSLDDLCRTCVVAGVNTLDGMEVLRRSQADVAISFGTGWIKTEALTCLPMERWNLHGGDPQKYRGLDSHLWALYHRDSEALVTVLHTLDPDLDRGAIIAGSAIDLTRSPELHMLRAANTELAISLVLGSLAYLEAVGQVPRMPQAAIGRYYSALPAALLETCERRYVAIANHERIER
jgi:methionyl-tRNA formyltransferase